MNRLLSLLLLLTLFGCASKKETEPKPQEPLNISFYHWKAHAEKTPGITKALEKVTLDTLYLHYFDVDLEGEESWSRQIFPKYVIQDIDSSLKSSPVVPVVYITNEAMAKAKPKRLAKKIKALVNEINRFHFNEPAPRLQLDCDWTETTRSNYFELLTLLNSDFELSATIRLHQIKYSQKTGVPPVKHGALMVYNVGDIADFKTNSILDSKVVDSYIDSSTTYPIPLSMALPIFSQTVLKNTVNRHRLIKGTDKAGLDKSKKVFRKEGDGVYEVMADTLYNGFFLTPGDRIKLEDLSAEEIVKSAEIVKNSGLIIKNTILYHLDDNSLQNHDINSLIGALK